jgi:L-lactate dehydrogenase complex protein LldG
MYEAFKARAEAVSAEVHRVATRADALEFIAKFLASESIADRPGDYAVWADDIRLSEAERRALAERTPGLRFEVTRESAAGAKVGITRIEWAVAQTGTLVTDSTSPASRLASSLAAIHIALVWTGGIVPDIGTAFARLGPERCGYIACITGPSRTADIERVLTIGVHGPERLIVVFVDEPWTPEQR